MDKQEREQAEEKVDKFLESGVWPDKDPRDTFGWCLLSRTSDIVDDDAAQGLDLAARVADRYAAEYPRRRVESRKRAARCLETQFCHLISAAHRMGGHLDKAQSAAERALSLDQGCQACLAETERQAGWLCNHSWAQSKEESDANRALEHFDKSLAIYRGLHPKTGHHIHKNGIAGVLHGRAVLRYYRGCHDAGIEDARAAVRSLDARRSPGLVVPCTHALAVYLAASGRPEHFEEAAGLLARIRERMPEQGGIRYAKVLWLAGLLEAEGEGYLVDARDIFLEKGYRREVVALTMDLVTYHGGDRRRQIEAVRSLTAWSRIGQNVAVWLEKEFGELVEVWESLRAGTLTPTLLTEIRSGLGEDLPPDLLAQR